MDSNKLDLNHAKKRHRDINSLVLNINKEVRTHRLQSQYHKSLL